MYNIDVKDLYKRKVVNMIYLFIRKKFGRFVFVSVLLL